MYHCRVVRVEMVGQNIIEQLQLGLPSLAITKVYGCESCFLAYSKSS